MSPSSKQRVLVVSHACVVPANQSVFERLADDGWDLDLVVPATWHHEYEDGAVRAVALDGLTDRLIPMPIKLAGQPQRHFYDPRSPHALLSARRPAVAFVEEESFSVSAFQWGRACWHAGIPFGVQGAENLDRALPPPARLMRRWTLRHAGFVAARSPKAKALTNSWGAKGVVEVIPHAVPGWEVLELPGADRPFTVGYAGRLVEEKGIGDLIAATDRLSGDTRVLLVGNGPLRAELERRSSDKTIIEVATKLKHEEMVVAYARMDVLVLPSHSTPTWEEQFGRVLVEALWCGVPIVGSSSGEIPWVVESTQGGLVFPEGDVAALAQILERLRRDPTERRRLAATGRDAVEQIFSVRAAADQLAQMFVCLSDKSNRAADALALKPHRGTRKSGASQAWSP